MLCTLYFGRYGTSFRPNLPIPYDILNLLASFDCIVVRGLMMDFLIDLGVTITVDWLFGNFRRPFRLLKVLSALIAITLLVVGLLFLFQHLSHVFDAKPTPIRSS